MTRSMNLHRAWTTPISARWPTGACAWLATAAMCGCVSVDPRAPPPGPPAAWVQPSLPLAPAPIAYEHRDGTIPPGLDMQATAPIDLGAPPAGPEVPLPAPAGPVMDLFPPMAPPAEDCPIPTAAACPTAKPGEPVVTQSMIDELSSQIASLDSRLTEQAAALDEARREAAAARAATQRLQTEFISWRAELDVVRDTIQAQSAADLQALDELNETLELLLKALPTTEPSPGATTPQQMAKENHRRGVLR